VTNGVKVAGGTALFFALLRICGIVALVFAALLVVLNSLPRDDAELRALVAFPERCQTGCFMGLRPGYTPIDTAIRALERNGWVREVHNGVSQASGSGEISWQWSESAPDVIDTAYPGRARARDGVVSAVIIQLRDSAGLAQIALFDEGAALNGVQWNVIAWHTCEPRREDYWRAPARMELSERTSGFGIGGFLPCVG
jgi:hypothetical protein